MKIVLLHADTKQEIDADVFESVTYLLHESFGDKAKQSTFEHLHVLRYCQELEEN